MERRGGQPIVVSAIGRCRQADQYLSRTPNAEDQSSELVDPNVMFQPLETGPSLSEPREQPWNTRQIGDASLSSVCL
ncbi:hypothetical protein ColLi_05925 [Colletotrichum liriopes]|uniref:Uncharacterized protein n=1 Tax=Colletotrichum liriopes TaxID=708192 RepID=A0AA37GMC7_9PEZI|nr:hypothetical protein ColLi_05925 [Colletotrichum liriopes]